MTVVQKSSAAAGKLPCPNPNPNPLRWCAQYLVLCRRFTSSFLKGDMFIVHNELDDGWMWVTNVRTEEQGLIVEDLVEEVVSTKGGVW